MWSASCLWSFFGVENKCCHSSTHLVDMEARINLR